MSFVSYRSALVLSCLLVAALLSAYASRPQQPDSNVVKVFLSPIDKSGNVITTLTSDDIRLFDDGKPQTIISFERTAGQVLSVEVLVDTSMSQAGLEKTSKLTARSFVESLMRSGKDQVSIVGFAGKATAEQELTTEKEAVLQAIERLHFATPASVGVGAILGGSPDHDTLANSSSAIWDTVWNVSERLSLFSNSGARRVILLLSDGEDTFSRKLPRDAIQQAQKYDVAIYAIGMGDKSYSSVRESTLKKLAEETGGRAFFPRKLIELQRIFTQLGEELRSPYVVRYLPTNRKLRGEIQKLKIEVSRPKFPDAKLDYRRAYLAP